MKAYEDDLRGNLEKPRRNPRLAQVQARIAAKKAKRGKPHRVMSATAHYAGDLTQTVLQGWLKGPEYPFLMLTNSSPAPVALFYNVANGFRNIPSYAITNEPHRRRDEITGLGTGLEVAGKVWLHIAPLTI
jgi:sterol 3beta-glucosyltransferase